MAKRGRPKTLPQSRVVATYLDNDTYDMLRHYAELRHIKLSEALRIAIHSSIFEFQSTHPHNRSATADK